MYITMVLKVQIHLLQCYQYFSSEKKLLAKTQLYFLERSIQAKKYILVLRTNNRYITVSYFLFYGTLSSKYLVHSPCFAEQSSKSQGECNRQHIQTHLGKEWHSLSLYKPRTDYIKCVFSLGSGKYKTSSYIV